MAWDLLFGFAGEVNFGPTFLIGLVAYTAAILNANYGVPIPLCLIAAALAAVVGGILLAVPALRLRGPYFGLVTLVAVLLLQNFVVIFAGVARPARSCRFRHRSKSVAALADRVIAMHLGERIAEGS